MITYILAMLTICAVPPEVSATSYLAAKRHGVDPITHGAYLCSEHGDDWTPRPGACSTRGACGPYQLSSLWPRHYGYRDEDRAHIWHAANMAAMVMVYSQESHQMCGDGHDWRAHLKASRKGRDGVGWIVRRWVRYEQRLREEVSDESDV
jgi:hypothetical protein